MKKIFILFFVFSFSLFAKAQEVMNVAGGESDGVIWSIGEVMTAMLHDDAETTYLTLGLIQPAQRASSGISFVESGLKPEVFPNPIVDNLYINWGKAFTWTIYNAAGKLLNSNQVAAGQGTVIDFSNYAAGYYMLVIMSEESFYSIKVIK